MNRGPGRGMKGKPSLKSIDKNTVKRLLAYLGDFKAAYFCITICIIVSAVAGVAGSMFMRILIDDYIKPLIGVESPVFTGLLTAVLIMGGIYLAGMLSTLVQGQISAIISQKILKNIRDRMFAHMETLPIRYFDTNTYGDIMSRYTNDVDTLSQMVSQSIPQIISSVFTVVAVFVAMITTNIPLTLFVLLFVALMMVVTSKVAGKSGMYFVRQQEAVGKLNGYIEEMVAGQKVIKVFCREDKVNAEFDERNAELCANATEANKFANILGPIMNNLGHLQYVLIAIIGGLLALGGFPGLTLGAIASFLLLSRSFVMPINQVAQQLNMIVMSLAGAQRIFKLLDEKSETDDGYVTLVNAEYKDGVLVEAAERTGLWAWKHPHTADGSVSYTELKGDIRFFDVDFEYNEGAPVLHNITLYAEPGQKVAFVGATGAGKTTITNLINRFYDIADGKIRYDDININKIKKADLRRSLGIVLQDVNLFTGTVMENIRYGKLDATDEECVAAAVRAGADSFISMLPEGYNTPLTGDGGELSQGQKQLISIARAAIADPPVMILDEATSSVDTRTETIIQRGMDALMEGRTVFVIAHRLSTVRNADVIMVLEMGHIIERGTHTQLIEEGGKYYHLYTGAFELE